MGIQGSPDSDQRFESGEIDCGPQFVLFYNLRENMTLRRGS